MSLSLGIGVAPASTPTTRMVIRLGDDVETVEQAIQIVSDHGGRVLHAFSPRTLIGILPSGSPLVAATKEAVSAAPLLLTPTEQVALAAWEHQESPEFQEAKARRPYEARAWGEIEPPDGEMRHGEPPAEEPGTMGAPPPDLSAYLIGSVAVGIVIVDGPTDALRFSEAERVKVTAEVEAGLTWLAQQEPAAHVTWAYDIQTPAIDVSPNKSLTGYEPLEALWRNPAFDAMGYSAGMGGVLEYVTHLRDTYQTRWAYAALFTKYPIQHFAYASKPRLVMHYRNNGWGVDNIDRVFAHETGHIFGCPDEYKESKCTCDARFGFLREPNGNCESCAAAFVPCLMAQNTYAMCAFTRVHLGWRDSDGDGRLDLDTEP